MRRKSDLVEMNDELSQQKRMGCLIGRWRISAVDRQWFCGNCL
jgi:hypothetical protein